MPVLSIVEGASPRSLVLSLLKGQADDGDVGAVGVKFV